MSFPLTCINSTKPLRKHTQDTTRAPGDTVELAKEGGRPLLSALITPFPPSAKILPSNKKAQKSTFPPPVRFERSFSKLS